MTVQSLRTNLVIWFVYAHDHFISLHLCTFSQYYMAPASTSAFVPVTYKRNKPSHRVLHESGFKIIPSPGDGHCLIHAFILSWSVQLITRSCPSFENVRSSIFLEAVSHRDLYLPFTCGDIAGFTKTMKNYILKGIYKSEFCDIVPLILSNIFGVNIVILNENAWNINDVEILPFSVYVMLSYI